MSQKKIVVVGSSNTDMVVKSGRLPVPGETVIGGDFFMNPGGKGANQAVAAARLGGDVSLVAKLGMDVFGQEAINGFKEQGIDTSCVFHDPEVPTGVALIMVDEKGQNSISVALGANNCLCPPEIDKAINLINQAAYVLVQLESPLDTVEYLVRVAYDMHVPVVLNPAPAYILPDVLLEKISIITPNETEAELLTGIKIESRNDVRMAASFLREKGVGVVIVTLGEKGAYVLSEDHDQLIPGKKVKALDTTAAGDTFNGALVAALADEMSLLDAVEFANKAAALSVTRMGAQSSVPYRKDIL